MKKCSIKIIVTTIVYLTSMLCIVFFFASRNKDDIRDKSHKAFLSAIKKEEKLSSNKLFFKFKAKKSCDSVSINDKIGWALQFFVTKEDSCRHRLDSIFKDEIKNLKLDLNTSIGYTFCGKTTNSANQQIKGTTIMLEKRFTKNNDKNNDIILSAYVYLPFNVIIGNNILYILAFLNIAMFAIYLRRKYQRKQIKENIIIAKPIEKTHNNTKWIILDNDILWNEDNCILKKGERTIILKGESLKFFKLFLKSESFFLKFNDMYKSYELKNNSPELKNRIYHSIKELKKDLKDFGINIKAVRGSGYQIKFK